MFFKGKREGFGSGEGEKVGSGQSLTVVVYLRGKDETASKIV